MQQLHIDRLDETTTYMLAHPEQHDQKKWHCGTAHCWAGLGDLLEANRRGVDIKGGSLKFVDAAYYGLNEQVWLTITKSSNTRDQIKLFVDAAIKGESYIICLNGADLIGADLRDVDLRRADLSGANLRCANLSGASLIDTYLIGADLIGANLIGADLRRANLRGASLIGADLSAAYLIGADLSGADLSGAYLRYAYLRYANLSGANLRGANLIDADLTNADLSGAILTDSAKVTLKLDLLTKNPIQAKMENH